MSIYQMSQFFDAKVFFCFSIAQPVLPTSDAFPIKWCKQRNKINEMFQTVHVQEMSMVYFACIEFACKRKINKCNKKMLFCALVKITPTPMQQQQAKLFGQVWWCC
jgi:hypothetical protein